jgi:hypothetical protein
MAMQGLVSLRNALRGDYHSLSKFPNVNVAMIHAVLTKPGRSLAVMLQCGILV